MIKIFYRTIKDKTLSELDHFKTGVWVVAEKPNREEVVRLAHELSLDTDLLSDALDPHEVPRVEQEAGVTYFFTRIPYRENKQVLTAPIMIAVGKTFVLLISGRTIPFTEKFIKEHTELYTTQKAKLFFQIVHEIIGMYNQLLTSIRKEVQQVQQTNVEFSEISNQDIMRFVRFEATLNDFLSSLTPTKDGLSTILVGKHFTLYEKDKDLIEDLFLGTGQLIESCRSNLKNLSNVRNAYSTIMTNNLNRVIKLLTALTIVLTIPTMVASFYGMNVVLPFSETHGAFWFVIGLAFLISAVVFLFLAHKKWF